MLSQSAYLRIRGLGVQVPPGAPLHPLKPQDGIIDSISSLQLICLALSRGSSPHQSCIDSSCFQQYPYTKKQDPWGV